MTLRLSVMLAVACALGTARPIDAQELFETGLSTQTTPMPDGWSTPASVPELIETSTTEIADAITETPREVRGNPLVPAPVEPLLPPADELAPDELAATLSRPLGDNWIDSVESDAVMLESEPIAAASTDLGLGPSLRPKILFRPAVPARDRSGQAILKPTVLLAETHQAEILPTPAEVPFVIPDPQQVYGDGRVTITERLRTPEPVKERKVNRAWVPSEIGKRLSEFGDQRPTPLANLFHNVAAAYRGQRGRDVGVGAERLPFALFELDPSQPSNNFRLRFEAGYNWEFPDRAEFFWSQLGGKGPRATLPIESSVDYHDIRLQTEVGGKKFSVATEIPLRFVDPTVLGNTGGLGDMIITTRTVMLDGDSLQITQVLRNQLATGSAASGRGVGHASMEPGFVAGYRYSERTMLHSELKLWFPLGGDPDASGPVLRYGAGWANVLYDSDRLAIIPTLEFVGWSVLGGQQTVGFEQVQDLDGLDIFNLYPGIRIVRDTGGDLGLFELGFGGGISVSPNHWYESLLRLELRWAF